MSLPLPWSALKETTRPVFAVHDFGDWKSKLKSDPWKDMLTLKQLVEPARFGGR